MTQNQLDIPQVSFERYFDLLKRRKWQALPLSVIGLLIGAIVASFVPQLFVADSILSYEGTATNQLLTSLKDPMIKLVSSAKHTIPNAVPDALHELGWPEAHGFGAAAFKEEVKERVTVHDNSPGGQGRVYAELRVTYKDPDIERAVEFTNTLVRIWIDQELAKLELKVAREVEVARSEVEQAELAVQNARMEVQIHEQTHRLDPADFDGTPDGERSELTVAHRDAEKEVNRLEFELERDRSQLASWRTRLSDGSIPPTMQGRETSEARGKVEKLLEPLEEQLAELREKLKAITQLHESYAPTKAAIEVAGQKVKELLDQIAKFATEPLPNKAYTALKLEADDLQGQVAAEEAQLARRNEELKQLTARKTAMPKIVSEYGHKRAKLVEATANKARLADTWLHAKSIDALVRSGQTINVVRDARIPSTPTESSATLIALAGSLIGLGIAIGLILLLDTLRTTFKTVDDVERALSVPVLGAMAYLQTAEDRVSISRLRRRVSMVCGAFVFLFVSLITVYYVAPWRLPVIVHLALDLLLGAPR